MEIKSADLPGIGKKYSFYTSEGSILVVIIHHSGKRELYYLCDEDSDEPCFAVDLSDDEARKIGAIMLGADYQPVVDDRVEIMRKNIRVEWITLAESSQFAGEKIKDARVRTLTGATIIGIQRGEEIIGSPDVEETLLPGDTLMIIGKKDQIAAFAKLAAGGK